MKNVILLYKNICFSDKLNLSNFIYSPGALAEGPEENTADWKRPMGPQYRPAHKSVSTTAPPSENVSLSYAGAAMPDFLKFVVTMRPASFAARADTWQKGSGYARVLESSRHLD